MKVAYRSDTNNVSTVGNLYSARLRFTPDKLVSCTSGVATVIAMLGGTSETAAVSFSIPSFYETPTYNGRGMILSDSRRRYVWDAAGRLTAVTNSGVSPAVLLKFAYYPDGRRATKTVLSFTNGVWATSRTLQYAWQGWKLAGECERDGAGAVTAVRSFVWGPDIEGQQSASLESGAEGIGGLLLIREWKPVRGERLYLPLNDGLGSVCGLIDAADGSLAAEYDYDPYGGQVVERGVAANACPFRHRTRYYDPETWLYYYGYRYYDPAVTKWISKDPLGEAGGWNLTAFCDNDPVNRFDPLGDKAYGNDSDGQMDWMDWREDKYTQEEVDKVYAHLAKRDRHIYNPGLGNSPAEREASRLLLERTLGVPVKDVWNPSFVGIGSGIEGFGSWISGDKITWRPWTWIRYGVGKPVEYVGKVTYWAGVPVDVGVAALDKIPIVRKIDPAYQSGIRLYEEAIEHVEQQESERARVFAWVHSKGSIYYNAIYDNLPPDERDTYLVATGMGEGGKPVFRLPGNIKYYQNYDAENFCLWRYDIVPEIADLNIIRRSKDIERVGFHGDSWWVHGLESYVHSIVLDKAKEYYKDNAKVIIGH